MISAYPQGHVYNVTAIEALNLPKIQQLYLSSLANIIASITEYITASTDRARQHSQSSSSLSTTEAIQCGLFHRSRAAGRRNTLGEKVFRWDRISPLSAYFQNTKNADFKTVSSALEYVTTSLMDQLIFGHKLNNIWQSAFGCITNQGCDWYSRWYLKYGISIDRRRWGAIRRIESSLGKNA